MPLGGTPPTSRFGFLAGGATINHDGGATGTMGTFVTDNGWDDLHPTVGEISLRVVNDASWTVHATTAPTNMRLADPGRIAVQAPFDGAATYDVWHAAT